MPQRYSERLLKNKRKTNKHCYTKPSSHFKSIGSLGLAITIVLNKAAFRTVLGGRRGFSLSGGSGGGRGSVTAATVAIAAVVVAVVVVAATAVSRGCRVLTATHSSIDFLI